MIPSVPLVFDAKKIRYNRNRAAAADPAHHFLPGWCMAQLLERLLFVRRAFPSVLQIGALARSGADIPGMETLTVADSASGPLALHEGARVQAACDMLPFASQSFDLVISPFALHTVNDLPGALAQARRVLRPDGLFMAALAGGETLHELRQSMMATELSLTGGASPRVFPFADKQQLGALMQRAGFALPVIDSENVVVTYGSTIGLMHDLRLMGEGNAVIHSNKKNPGKSYFLNVDRIYRERFPSGQAENRIDATFEILFLLGWAPHESQQKPLRPGQASARLADALAAAEQSTGERSAP